jgi:prepilin-type N-terminal cleavage/methylation domain-containing protein
VAPRLRGLRRRPDRTTGTRGFTLLELMLVMVILALLVAVTWPTLRRPAIRSVTEQAARQLVHDLAQARIAAIESGQTLSLRYELTGSRYVIQPAESGADETPADLAGDGDRTVSGSRTDTDPRPTRFELELDAEVTFADPDEQPDHDQFPAGSAVGQMLREQWQETEEVAPRVNLARDEGDLSPPILFYPTGRAENARFLLRGPDGYRVTVTLRGLTGAVSAGTATRPPDARTRPERDVSRARDSRPERITPGEFEDRPR